jgi:hypothetical protein
MIINDLYAYSWVARRVFKYLNTYKLYVFIAVNQIFIQIK